MSPVFLSSFHLLSHVAKVTHVNCYYVVFFPLSVFTWKQTGEGST